jgi:uncharacterized protein YdhG (YjbR/CyaY superfamily)
MGKTKPTSPEIDAFIAGTPAPARNMLMKMREAIRSTLPAEAQEVISYRMPAFKLKKMLVWYAAFQDHCSLFPTATVVEQFRDDLTRFKTAKGTVQFPLDKPLPLPLIKKLVKARLQQSGYKPDKRAL